MAPKRKKITKIRRDEPNKVDDGESPANKIIEAGATVATQEVGIQPSDSISAGRRPLMKLFPVKQLFTTTTKPLKGRDLHPSQDLTTNVLDSVNDESAETQRWNRNILLAYEKYGADILRVAKLEDFKNPIIAWSPEKRARLEALNIQISSEPIPSKRFLANDCLDVPNRQPATATRPTESVSGTLPSHGLPDSSHMAAKTVCPTTHEEGHFDRRNAKRARILRWHHLLGLQYKSDVPIHKAWLMKNMATIHHELQDIDDFVGEDPPDFEDCVVWLQYRVLLFGETNITFSPEKIIPVFTENDMETYEITIEHYSCSALRHTTLYPTGKWSNPPTKRRVMGRLRRLAGEPPKPQMRVQEPETIEATSLKKKKPKNPAVPLEFKEKLQKASSARKPLLYGDEESSHTFSQAYKCPEASTIHSLQQIQSWYTRVRQEDLQSSEESLQGILK